jgi:hypothetical protein
MDEQRPWVVLFPHLPLTQTLRLGDRWEVWPLADFDGPWATDWFEDVVRRIAAKHVTSGGTSVRNPALLVDAQSGITGEAPDEDDRSAIEAALGFGVVDAGSFWRPRAELELIAEYEAHLGGKPVADVLEELVERNENRQYAGWSVGTSDNAEPYIWPLNDDASIAMQYGAIVRTTVGGSVRVMAPYELNLPLSLSLDEDRVSALYQVLSEAPIDRGARQLREALRWMLQAWRNTPSVHVEHRVVLLRTAFEVLLAHGEQVNKETLARRLSDRFAELVGEDHVRPGQMLWRPGLERDVVRVERANPKFAPFNDLERWFIGFSLARNAIVHDGASPDLEDPTEASVFAGEYWWVATRVLRDLTLAELHARGHEQLWADSLSRAARAAWARLAAEEQPGGDRR